MGCEIKSGEMFFIDIGQRPAKMKLCGVIAESIEISSTYNFVGIIPTEGKPIATTKDRVFGKYELDDNLFSSDTISAVEETYGYQSQALEDPVWN